MGTTLVQRLLCSSRNGLIYGDTIGNEAAFFISWLSSKEFGMRNQAERSDPMLDAVLAGDTTDFIAELAPKVDGYLDELAKLATGPLAYCKAEAARHGRTVWGWKHAGAQTWLVNLLPQVLPHARIIRVDRDLKDAARSAKAVHLVGPGQDFERFVRDAAASRIALANLDGRLPVFDVALPDLLENPERVIAGMEDFTGCEAIDRRVLSVKVNHPQSPWIPPMDLSDEESAVVGQFEPSSDHARVA